MRVLYRDDALVIVDKPSGLATHRGWAGDDEEAALQQARDAVGTHVYPVHRLDRGASGALVFALSSATARLLHEAFERGEVDKRYLAAVRGAPPAEGVIDHPITRREDGPRVPAVTAYRTVAVTTVSFENGRPQAYALVECRPKTGRLHQIRRHLKHINHPLLGDVNYGRGEHNRWCRERYGLVRLALHAVSLAFAHPLTGVAVAVESPLADDLAVPLAAMGLEIRK